MIAQTMLIRRILESRKDLEHKNWKAQWYLRHFTSACKRDNLGRHHDLSLGCRAWSILVLSLLYAEMAILRALISSSSSSYYVERIRVYFRSRNHQAHALRHSVSCLRHGVTQQQLFNQDTSTAEVRWADRQWFENETRNWTSYKSNNFFVN